MKYIFIRYDIEQAKTKDMKSLYIYAINTDGICFTSYIFSILHCVRGLVG